MSYSISEGLDDAKKDLRACKAIAEAYPDAYSTSLPDRRRVWVSDSVREPTDFMIVAAKRDADDSYTVWFCPYVLVEGRAVFVRRDRWILDATITTGKEAQRHALLMLLLEFK